MTLPSRQTLQRATRLHPILRPLALSQTERVILVEALRVLIRVRIALTTRNFDRIRQDIVGHGATKTAELSDMRQVAWAVGAMARFVPKATCLTQALAGQMLLARRGGNSTLRLSIALDSGSDFKPHAWLMSGDMILLGGSSDIYSRHRALADYDSNSLAAQPANSLTTAS